jgi:hypothetical protein
MNYGYEPTNNDDKLAAALAKLLEDFPADAHGRRPYIERNGPYSGVRIRRITHLAEEQINRLVAAADTIHERLTG